MPVHNLDSLSDDDVSENRKEGEDCGHSSLAIDGEERHVIDLEAICEISYSYPIIITSTLSD